MSHLVSRILLSIFMFPLATVFYIFVCVIAERDMHGPEAEVFLVSTVLTWVVVAVYWCLLWRSVVRWNSFRVRGAFLASLVAATGGVGVGALAGVLIGRVDNSFGVFVGGMSAIVMWLIATVFIWRETAGERAARVKGSGKSAVTCPTCGYNLTGLSECRCPECGSKFTVDELMGLQVGMERDVE